MDTKEHMDLVQYEIPRMVNDISRKFGLKIVNQNTSELCLLICFKDLLFTIKGLKEALDIMSEKDLDELTSKAMSALFTDHTTMMLSINSVDLNMDSVCKEDLKPELIKDYIKYIRIKDFLYEEFYVLLDLMNK